MKSKIKKDKKNSSKQIAEDNDFEINRSMYYLGKALYQFSIMHLDKVKNKKELPKTY